jgi:hypothetical protein
MTEDHDDPAPLPRPRENDRPHFAEPLDPPSRPPASAATVWAGVAVATTVILAAVVVALVIINQNHRSPVSAPPHSSSAPASSSSPPAVASSLPAAQPIGPGLASFAREWRGMRQQIVIDLAGHGQFHYMMACASCSMAEMPYNTLDFTLDSVSGGSANGTVTASSDPQNPVGEPVAATLGPRDTIQWSLGGKDIGMFCGSDPAWCGG